jgi:hypothetical protein
MFVDICCAAILQLNLHGHMHLIGSGTRSTEASWHMCVSDLAEPCTRLQRTRHLLAHITCFELVCAARSSNWVMTCSSAGLGVPEGKRSDPVLVGTSRLAGAYCAQRPCREPSASPGQCCCCRSCQSPPADSSCSRHAALSILLLLLLMCNVLQIMLYKRPINQCLH